MSDSALLIARELPALRLQLLRVCGYRNLATGELEPEGNFNVLCGDNAAGKSNLLEAIYYVGALSSFRGARVDDVVSTHGDRATVCARLKGAAEPRDYRITLARQGGRQLELDGKRPRSTASWIASLQMVVFHPREVEIASGGPETRRHFVDRVIQQMDPTYSAALSGYERALRSRNRLLREHADQRSVTSFDDLLASSGSVICRARACLVADIAMHAVDTWAELTDGESQLVVEYRPRVEPTFESIRMALAQSIAKDLDRGFTAEGPHADDVGLSIGGSAPRHHASQGQQRAIVLALKLAALSALAARVRCLPVLLLDDVSSELDQVRNRRLFARLGRTGCQVFLTTTDPLLIRVDERRRDYRIEHGRIISM